MPPCIAMPDARRAHAVLADAVVRPGARRGRRRVCWPALVGQLDAGVAGEVGGAGDEAGEVVERPRRAPWPSPGGWRSSRPARTSAGRPPSPSCRCRARPRPTPPARRRRGRRAPPASGPWRRRQRSRDGARGTASTTSSGAQNGSSGMPMTSLVARDVLGRERVAVGGRVVGVVGRRRADVRAQHEQRRAACRRRGPRAARPRGRRSRRRSRRGTRRSSRRPRSAARRRRSSTARSCRRS